ncbi:MAG TPA: hypothetical protein VEU62_10250, partial [Bryobacterales bacterium]|nr:hypothetical protein [Bryobacterales bacterium]
IVPMSIAGTREVLPPGSIFVRPGRVELCFGRPIPTAGLSVHDASRLLAELRERIIELRPGAGQSAARATIRK